jgi:nucleotide-binding universal stress UspA family protein
MKQTLSILVASDLSDAGGYAFERAARLAQRVPNAALQFLHVTDGDASEARVRQLGGQLAIYVAEKAASLGGLDGMRVGVHVRHGDAVREIAQLAAEIDALLIVLGTATHPRLMSLIAGGVADKLMLHAPCPIILAGPKPAEPLVHQPAIEPPCPDCAKARAASNGREWWCARHRSSGGSMPRHSYSYESELPFSTHDNEVIPTGVAF